MKARHYHVISGKGQTRQAKGRRATPMGRVEQRTQRVRPTGSEPERFSPAVHQSGDLNGFVVRAELGDTPRSRESSYSLRPFAQSKGYGESMSDWVTMRRFHESKGVEDWRVGGEGACAYFRPGAFAAGTRPVNAISELAGLQDHPPAPDLRHQGGIVRLITVPAHYYRL